jgi:hypothetical protein
MPSREIQRGTAGSESQVPCGAADRWSTNNNVLLVEQVSRVLDAGGLSTSSRHFNQPESHNPNGRVQAFKLEKFAPILESFPQSDSEIRATKRVRRMKKQLRKTRHLSESIRGLTRLLSAPLIWQPPDHSE